LTRLNSPQRCGGSPAGTRALPPDSWPGPQDPAVLAGRAAANRHSSGSGALVIQRSTSTLIKAVPAEGLHELLGDTLTCGEARKAGLIDTIPAAIDIAVPRGSTYDLEREQLDVA
jgi:hypothetical protein